MVDINLVLLCVFAFLAGFIDSIVGGGGLVQIPAFFVLYPQLSIQQVLGTNRMASLVGTSVAAWNYTRTVAVPWKSVIWAGISAAVFSFLGVTIQRYFPPDIFKPILLVLIIGIAWFTYRKKDFGDTDIKKFEPEKLPIYALTVGGVLGFYNGFVGPGTGSLLVFAFVSILGFNFLRASAASKIVNVVADLSSLAFFLYHGQVLFHLTVPLMICNIAGSYLGSRMAVLRGNTFIRKVFIVVITGIVLRFAWDIFK